MKDRCEFCNENLAVLKQYGYGYCVDCAEEHADELSEEIEALRLNLKNIEAKINKAKGTPKDDI